MTVSPWRIERLGRHGNAIARGPDGQKALAPRLLPGELVTAEASDGHLLNPKIIEPSSDRVRPPCRHYATCGGCALMHASDDFVARWKSELVASALAAHRIETKIAGIATSPSHSRRRAVLSGRRTKKGALLGFHGRASDQIVDITNCHVLRPGIVAALPALRQVVSAGASRSGELSLTVTETRSGLDVAVSGGKPLDPALTEQLSALMRKADLARLDWDGTPLTRRQPLLNMGQTRVTPPPGGFLQATAEGEAALLSVVRKTTEGATSIVDLFAGCGTFSLPLAAHADIHAVEGLSAPLHALDAAWRTTPGLHRITTEIRDLASRPLMPDELARFDAAVIDPPRSGAAAQAEHLAASALARIAWVSCNPVTFARDAATMIKAGWRMGPVYVVDQFRWSTHVETVTSFTRN
ncbi:class I SAM-dependent RNA methyltransferase [Paracoccus sp. SCSIO 75233]|uniref:class I SAM-dependent RNA methyltransferase n=1 Tax=Paracoccus sp. SCSIO 75233 TaxID=3017782 RepID=UPI0022F0E4B4|nr:class I SAM-dependent RNA methyltransferase [Paracoccus sp. SCSIO 75233]WBU53122.1 class I SAM-dependent RNA methyltransferase [Paracoccus sp. SCSIO 75233]